MVSLILCNLGCIAVGVEKSDEMRGYFIQFSRNLEYLFCEQHMNLSAMSILLEFVFEVVDCEKCRNLIWSINCGEEGAVLLRFIVGDVKKNYKL